jgi:hypothetical protein
MRRSGGWTSTVLLGLIDCALATTRKTLRLISALCTSKALVLAFRETSSERAGALA